LDVLDAIKSDPNMRSTSRRIPPNDHERARTTAHLDELRALYEKTDALFANMSCDASTDCCRFGVTGREPYPTAIEIEFLRRALAATGRKVGAKKRLPVANERERRCPMLSDEGRCIVYEARPFGCRTFFCDRAQGNAPPRADVSRLSNRIADLSASFEPANPGPRPLSRVELC
jgi:Fe-S-cluster containining protein